jgi:secreted Zn-dependent insulinase-like peptidase
VNEEMIDLEISESLIFPAVREQLSVDGCARQFFVNLNGIEASDVRSLELLLSGESISLRQSEAQLFGFLGNTQLERLFLGRLKANDRMNLSELTKKRRLDFESINLSAVSIDALDSLLLHEIVTVESEDSLLWIMLSLGSDYRDLPRHIKIEFLSVGDSSRINLDLGG